MCSGKIVQLVLVLLVFCGCGGRWAHAQEETAYQSEATLVIVLEPQADRASASFRAVSKIPLRPDVDAAQKEVTAAFTQAFGGNVGLVEYNDYTGSSKEDEYDEEYPPAQSSKTKPALYTWGADITQLGGNKGGPVRRTQGLQKGEFKPAPILALLRGSLAKNLRVTIQFQDRNAPYVECIGAKREQTEEFNLRLGRIQPIVYFEKTIPVNSAAAPEPITFVSGYRTIDLAKKIAPAIALMLVTLIATLIYRQRAFAAIRKIDAGTSDPNKARTAREAIRFGYLRLITLGSPILSGAWAVIYFLSHPTDPLLWFIRANSIEALVGIGMLSYALPLFVTINACVLLSLPIMRQVRVDKEISDEPDVSVGTLLLRMGGQFVLTLVPLLFFIMGITLIVSSPGMKIFLYIWRSSHVVPGAIWGQVSRMLGFRWLGWFLLAFGIRPFLQQIMVVASGTPPLILTDGPLVQRVRELAQKAGVNLRQILFMPTGPDRSANAFAVIGNIVAFTDRLLGELSRREVDGIIAHELIHLKRQHPQALRRAQWIFGYGPIIGLLVLEWTHKIPAKWSPYLWAAVIPVTTLLAALVTRAMSRRFEWEADTQAVALTGDAEGLILGLDRLRRLSGLPEDWGRADSSILTHPSTARRIAYLSAAGQLSPEAKAALESRAEIMDSATEKERYRVSTDALKSSHFVFSTLTRQEQLLVASLMSLLIFAGIPLVAAALGERFAVPHLSYPSGLPPAYQSEWEMYAPKPMPNWPLLLAFYAAGIIGAFLCYVVMVNLYSTLPYRKKEPILRRRLIADGKLTEQEATNALYVGLAPGKFPRLYSGGLGWDIGYLIFGEEGRLRFVGEKTQFTLYPDQVKELRISPYRWPSLIPLPRVELTWQGRTEEADAEGTASVLLAIGGARSLFILRQNVSELLTRLQLWHQKSLPEAPITHEPIPVFETTGETKPQQLANPLIWIVSYLPMTAIAIGMALLVNLPGRDAIFCGIVVMIMVLSEWSRILRYREA